MSEKYISLDNLKSYNKQMKETYVEPLEDRLAEVEGKTKDYPRTEVKLIELANGEYTSEPQEDLGGIFAAFIPWEVEEHDYPFTINVTFDDVVYNDVSIIFNAELNSLVAGNLSKANLLGFAFEDTGEPFMLLITSSAVGLATDLTQSTTHSVIITTTVKEIKKLDIKYMHQSDWNQNYWDAGDFIKNRPCCVEFVMDEIVVDDVITTEPIAEYNGAYGKIFEWYQDIYNIPYVNIRLDYRDYLNLPLTYVEALNGYAAGNLSKLNVFGCSYEDTGEPFVLGVASDIVIFATDMTKSTSHSIILWTLTEQVHKLDEKYLPNNVALKDEVALKTDLINYFTTQQINSKFANYSTTSQVQSMINSAINTAIGGSY